MASNEELAQMVKSGERDRLIELWQQIRRMALKEAVRWAAYHSNGVELDDLEQAGFIALMRAVNGFDPTAGTLFSTWYHRILWTEFEAATGRRTERQRRDPLDAAVSLDVPVGEDENDTTLEEMIPDPAAAQAFEDVAERMQRERLHAALEAAIATLPPELQAAIRGRYYRGEVVDSKAHAKAIRLLRNPRCSGALRAYLL